MKILIAGATGFVGYNLIQHLKNHHTIYALGRDKNKINKFFPKNEYKNIYAINWKELNTLDPITFDVIINLAGETINHIFWSKKIKSLILNSRLYATKELIKWCSTNKNIHFINASALSIYGLYKQKSKKENTEEKEIIDHNDFLYKVAHLWEEEVKNLESLNIKYSLTRFAVVLGNNGGALEKLILPAKLCLGAKLGTGDQPFAWVSITDLVHAIDFIIEKRVFGPVNIVSPDRKTQNEFTKELCKSINRPYLFKIPSFFIQLFLGQMGEEIILQGQDAIPAALLKLGFKFKHRSLKNALKQINSNL